MKKGEFPKGESLLEAIIAITILLITLTFVGDTFSGSIRALSFSRDQAIASFLAREGKEATKNILLSNELRFPSDPDTCWNAGFTAEIAPDGGKMPVENADDCEANPLGFAEGWTRIASDRDDPSVYAASIQFFQLLLYGDTGRFVLEPLPTGEGLFTYDDQDKFVLNLTRQNCDPQPAPCISKNTSAEPYAVVKTDSGFYNYVKDAPNPKFWRGIGIVYFDSEPTDEDGNPETLPDSMKVISVVAFEEGGEFKFVVETL